MTSYDLLWLEPKKVERRLWDYVSGRGTCDGNWRCQTENCETAECIKGTKQWIYSNYIYNIYVPQRRSICNGQSGALFRWCRALVCQDQIIKQKKTKFSVRHWDQARTSTLRIPWDSLGVSSCFEVSNLTLGEPRFLKGWSWQCFPEWQFLYLFCVAMCQA